DVLRSPIQTQNLEHRTSHSSGGSGLFLRDAFIARLGRLFQNAAFWAEVPTDAVLLELGGAEPRGLERPVDVQFGPRPSHQLLRPPRDQEHQTKLAVHTFGQLLNHSLSLSSEIRRESVEGAPPGEPE